MGKFFCRWIQIHLKRSWLPDCSVSLSILSSFYFRCEWSAWIKVNKPCSYFSYCLHLQLTVWFRIAKERILIDHHIPCSPWFVMFFHRSQVTLYFRSPEIINFSMRSRVDFFFIAKYTYSLICSFEFILKVIGFCFQLYLQVFLAFFIQISLFLILIFSKILIFLIWDFRYLLYLIFGIFMLLPVYGKRTSEKFEASLLSFWINMLFECFINIFRLFLRMSYYYAQFRAKFFAVWTFEVSS